MTTCTKHPHAKFGSAPISRPEEDASGIELIDDFGVFLKIGFFQVNLPPEDEVIDGRENHLRGSRFSSTF